MPHINPPIGEGCNHPAWAKEKTVIGGSICRICNPKPNPDDPMFL